MSRSWRGTASTGSRISGCKFENALLIPARSKEFAEAYAEELCKHNKKYLEAREERIEVSGQVERLNEVYNMPSARSAHSGYGHNSEGYTPHTFQQQETPRSNNS